MSQPQFVSMDASEEFHYHVENNYLQDHSDPLDLLIQEEESLAQEQALSVIHFALTA